MYGVVRGMFYFVFTVFGGLCGFSIAQHTLRFYDTLSPVGRNTNFAAFILLGILVGVTLAPIASNLVLKAVDSVAHALQRLTLRQVLMGSAGLLFGLIVSFFASFAIRLIDFSRIPAIGLYVGPFLIVISTIFLACLGAFFGSRMVFIHSFRDVLGSGGGGSWGSHYYLLDTSAVVDGRIGDIVDSGFLHGTLVVPQFVLNEIQQIADSHDPLRRNRGRRGLDVLDKLRQRLAIHIENKDYTDIQGVDGKLVRLAQEQKVPLVTTDYNLQKVAALQEVRVLNINALASALKPIVLPGEEMMVQIIRSGKEAGQGVGFLDDGTMLVVDRGRDHIGETVLVEVTSVVQTSAGKMIFSRYREPARGLTEDSRRGSSPVERNA